MTIQFDPLNYVRQLEAAGVSLAQAEVHAGALTHALVDVAFARDLVRLEENLRQEMHHVEERTVMRLDLIKAEILARIDQMGARADAKSDQLESRVGARLDKMEGRMASCENELIVHRWVLGFILASILAQFAVLYRALIS